MYNVKIMRLWFKDNLENSQLDISQAKTFLAACAIGNALDI